MGRDSWFEIQLDTPGNLIHGADPGIELPLYFSVIHSAKAGTACAGYTGRTCGSFIRSPRGLTDHHVFVENLRYIMFPLRI